MENTRSRSRVLGLAGLFVLTTIGMAIWVGVTVRRDTSIDSRVGEQHVGSEHPKPTTAPSVDMRTTLSGVPTTPVDPNATGRLCIHCVDATTGADLPGLKWVVGTQSGDDRLRDSGATDASGRATAHNLTEGTLLVFTIRAPPHAQSFAAVELALGETKVVELRVGVGGRVHGRVLDDLLQPIENAEILCANDYQPPLLKREIPEESSKVATHTDSLGRYEIEYVCSTPGTVRIVDGKSRPASWGDLEITARLDGASRAVGIPVQPGETKEAPDIVLPRARNWSGRVVDVAGHGVEGALLSLNWFRSYDRFLVFGKPRAGSRPPSSDGFVLMPGETLTRAEGRFEVKNGEEPQNIWVVRPSGAAEMVALPPVEPGGVADNVLIILKDTSSVGLDLVDADGKPAQVPNPRIVSPGTNTRTGRSRFFQALRLCFITSEGANRPATISDDGAGGFTAQVDGRIEDATSFALTASGWAPKSGAIAQRLIDGGRLRIQLEDQLCIRIHLHVHDLKRSSNLDSEVRACLHACLLSEAERAERDVRCCGMGSTEYFPIVNGDRDVVLPVDVKRPFHVSLSATGMKSAVDHPLCMPGDPPLSIDLDGRDLPDVDESQSTSVKTGDESANPVGGVRAILIDSVTGRPVSGAYFVLRDSAQGKRSAYSSHTTDSQLISETNVPVGTWTAAVSAEQHRQQNVSNVTIREGETTDLGRIALEPIPCTRFVLQEADGTPVPRYGGSVHVCDGEGRSSLSFWSSNNSEEGAVLCPADLPEHLLMQVNVSDTSAQWIRTDRGPEVIVLRLAPWHDIDVRINGVASSYPNANLDVRILPESVAGSSFSKSIPGKPSAPYGLTVELEVPVGQPRVFRTHLGPGRYVVEAKSPMFQVTTRTFEVGSSDGPVRVDLESTE